MNKSLNLFIFGSALTNVEYGNPIEMNNKKITVKIGQAIREGKYLDITYKNKQDEVKHFWISILDITSNDKIVVNMFNVMKDEPLLKRPISISSIQSAETTTTTRR